ncbi:MAG: tetratricopeptide (TPR) repeat protein [Verrucomicrobiales bacterium]|jgi:tetratricopeptide (TPR) repeat protein
MMGRWLKEQKLLPLFSVMLALVVVLPAHGHHGPEEMIAVLTQRMESGGETPLLLHKRATEWRTLGEFEKAIADLDRALVLNPRFVEGLEQLAEVYLMQGAIDRAIATARAGIAASRNGRESAACQMALARALQKKGKPQEALKSCNAAFVSYPRGNIDWYLVRGVLQRQLGLHEQRIADFRAGYQETHSVVLRNFMVDATIDAGRAQEVMPLINEQVAACRLKSSWLLRRARARWSLNDKDAARDDLANVIAELERRIHPIRPDVTLLVDRGIARALLGNVTGAREDLAHARKIGHSPAMLVLLEETLSSADADRTSIPITPANDS